MPIATNSSRIVVGTEGPLSDEKLFLLYRAGELSAFHELYQRHSRRVLGYLRKKLSSEEAEDAFQDVFSKLHKSREKYDPKYPFLAWLYTIARHVAIDTLRRRKPMNAVDFLADTDTQDVDWDHLVQPLSEGEKELLKLRFVEGLTFDEIGRKLGVRPAAARKRASRAFALLRKVFGKGGVV